MAGTLSAHDRHVLTAVSAGASSLSFVGSGFIVLCYVLFKELRKFSFKLVFYLALSVRLSLSLSLSLSYLIMLCLIKKTRLNWDLVDFFLGSKCLTLLASCLKELTIEDYTGLGHTFPFLFKLGFWRLE